MKNKKKNLLGNLVLLSGIIFTLLPSDCLSAERVLVQTKENVRLSPNGRKVGRLNEGIWLQQLSEQERWVNFQLTGWIYAKSIRIEKDGSLYITTKENIRAGANGEKIGELNKGTRLKKVSKSGGWIKFSLKAWIWKDSLVSSAQMKKQNYEDGLRYGMQGEFKEAKSYFRKTLEIDQYDDFARTGLSVLDDVLNNRIKKETALPLLKGMGYINKGFVEESIKQYHIALKSDTAYSQSYALRAMSYNQAGEYKKSAKDYNRAIKCEPGSRDLYYLRGVALANAGKYKHAVTDFNSAIQVGTKNDKRLADIHIRRGNAYHAQKKYAPAIKDYNAAEKLNPVNPDIYAYRGKAYEQSGRNDIAALDFQKMNSLTKQNIEHFPQSQPSGIMSQQRVSDPQFKEPKWREQLRYQPPAQQIQQPQFQPPPQPIQQPQFQPPPQQIQQPQFQPPTQQIQQPRYQPPAQPIQQPQFQPPPQQFQQPRFEQPKFNPPPMNDPWKP